MMKVVDPPSSRPPSSSSSSSNTPLLQMLPLEKLVVLDNHWLPVIEKRLDKCFLNEITFSFEGYAKYFTKLEKYYLKSQRFIFLFDFSKTLSRLIKDYILFKFINYPATTVKLLRDDFLLDYPNIEKGGTVKTIIDRQLHRMVRIKLLTIKILDDLPNKKLRKTQCFLAPWATNQHFSKVYQQYEHFSKVIGFNQEKLTEEEAKPIEKVFCKFPECTERASFRCKYCLKTFCGAHISSFNTKKAHNSCKGKPLNRTDFLKLEG